MNASLRRRLGGGLASLLLAALVVAGCGDTDPPVDEPTSPEAPSTSSSIESYNDTDDDGAPPGGEDHEGSDPEANPDSEETDR